MVLVFIIMVIFLVFIIDNGVYEIKVGILGVDWELRCVNCFLGFLMVIELSWLYCRVLFNFIVRLRIEKRVYVGDDIDNCKDFFGIVYRWLFEKVCI